LPDDLAPGPSSPAVEIIHLFGELFRRSTTDETNLPATKPFPACGADVRKQRKVINPATKRGSVGCQNGDDLMRTLSFILAFASMLAGPLMTGSSENTVPGVGTFAYNGSPIAVAPPAIVLAAR
jgi:hypothetical protein